MDIVKLNWPRSFHRQKPFPLQDNELFDSLENAEIYALSGETSYIGQIVTVVDEVSSAVTVYKINFDRTLSILGEGDVDAEEVKTIIENVLAGKNYTTLEEVSELVKQEIDNSKFITAEEFSGLTSEFATKAEIPTKTSQLHNDSGFITKDDITGITVNVPTKTSDLENDSGFITIEEFSGLTSEFATKKEIPTKVSQLEDSKEYLKKSELPPISGFTEAVVYKADEDTLTSTTNEDKEVIFSVKEIEQSKVKGLTGTLEQLQNNNGELQTKVETLSKTLNETNTSIGELQKKDENHDAAIGQIQSKLQTQQGELETQKETLETQKGKLDKLADKTNTLEEQLKNIDVGVKTISARKIFDGTIDEFAVETNGNDVSIKLNGFDGGEVVTL